MSGANPTAPKVHHVGELAFVLESDVYDVATWRAQLPAGHIAVELRPGNVETVVRLTCVRARQVDWTAQLRIAVQPWTEVAAPLRAVLLWCTAHPDVPHEHGETLEDWLVMARGVLLSEDPQLRAEVLRLHGGYVLLGPRLVRRSKAYRNSIARFLASLRTTSGLPAPERAAS